MSARMSLSTAPPAGAADNAARGADAVSSLMRWSTGQCIPDETFARLLAHPNLTAATRTLAVKMLDASDRDRALDGIFKDAGRYVAATLVVYLDAAGELTLPKLKALCAASGLLSPGRARALLAYLRYLDYIVPLPADERKGAARYAPTDTLRGAWRAHFRAALEAASFIEPAVALVLDRLDDPAIFTAFARQHTQELIDGIALDAHRDQAFMRLIMHRHAGIQIIWTLLAASPDAFPPEGPIPLSIGAVARRFRVSRIHVQRLLDEAERAKLIGRTGDGAVLLLDGARAYRRHTYPMQLIWLLSASAKTVAAFPEIDRKAGAWDIAVPASRAPALAI